MAIWVETVVKLVVASLLGGLIGWEREKRGKPAGLRTLMLVSLAAAMFVLATRQAAQAAGEPIDAARAMAGVAQGVGFLGAGLILRTRGEVYWLTTAASLWAAAALGVAVAQGLYPLAVAGAILAYIILRWVSILEDRLAQGRSHEMTQRGDDDR